MTKFNGKILLTEDITRKVNKVAINEWGGWENQKMLHRLETVAQEAAEVAITEYDKIARQEERERCIKVAIEVYADLLSAKGYDIGSVNSELQRLRKAIEEGGK